MFLFSRKFRVKAKIAGKKQPLLNEVIMSAKMGKVVALVPMRHHSQRVPGKNYRLLDGKPLFHHIIKTLLEVSEIDVVVVNTDSPDIITGLAEFFPSVQVIFRPEDLRADDVPMNEILTYDTSQVKADFYLQTHSTNPLLRSETISSAIQNLLATYPTYDSLFSVTRLQTRLWDQLGRAINHNPAVLLQTQDLPPVYEENSCLYIFTRQTLLERRNRLGERPMMFEIDAAEAWDIDEELDFALAEFLMREWRRFRG
jgi:CMP-N-acetylneuraminic acid synthetase